MYNREAVFNTLKEEKYKELNELQSLLTNIKVLVENTPNDMDLGKEIRTLLTNNK